METVTQTKHAFKVEYMQPFVRSLKFLFEDHLGDKLEIGKMRVNSTGRPPYELSGVINFTGDVIGRAVLSVSWEVAEGIVKAYLGIDPIPEGAVPDCIGELTNIVVGRAKSSLESHNIVISPPTVIDGTDYTIAPRRGAACISIPCQCKHGPIQLEISIVSNESVMGVKL